MDKDIQLMWHAAFVRAGVTHDDIESGVYPQDKSWSQYIPHLVELAWSDLCETSRAVAILSAIGTMNRRNNPGVGFGRYGGKSCQPPNSN